MSRLAELRKVKGISQKKLSDLAGISVRVEQNYEQDIRDINKAAAVTVYRLAKALNCTVEDILEIDRIDEE